MIRALIFGVVVLSGCKTKPDTQVHEIGIDSLTRSHQVAASFSGKLVKVTIQPSSYAVVGRELHVRGTVANTPPIVVFKLSPVSSLPDPKLPVTIIGRCEAPVRDGIYRSSRADYSLAVTDCLTAQ